MHCRNKMYFQIVLPAFFVSLAMIFTLILPALVEEPELEISPWIYPTKVSTSYSFLLLNILWSTFGYNIVLNF